MRHAIRIGRLFGIDLAIDTSWLFIFSIVVWSLTSLVRVWHPLWTGATVFTVALVTGLAFFASVVFHELAHALVAKLYGIPVRDITLHMFGGVSNIEREPPTPGAELLIAIVGPIASVALGVAMLALAVATSGEALLAPAEGGGGAAEVMGRLDPTITLLMWLGPVNIAVGLFNLVPGFPLDGGRILRALLWRITGSLHTATRWSTSIGQGVGLSFVALGCAMALGAHVPVLGGGFASGLWLALIGMFLRGAARQHQAGADVVEALEGVPVAALMRTSCTGIPSNTSIRKLVEVWFVRRDEGVFPVFFGERFLGVVGADDIVKVPRDEWERHTAREILREASSLPAIAPADLAYDALRAMSAAGLKGAPVVRDGEVVGMLFERDVARWLLVDRRPLVHAGPDRARHA